jgi:NTP pyrophosphatase (non-canonical NTP hydrolase)
MTVADYERAALRTVNPENVDKFDGHGLIFEAVTGLNEEAGECSGIIKKHVFQGHELDRDHLAEELGDVAWYLVLCCKAVGLKFEDVLQMNNTKRAERYPDGFDKARSINRKQ